MTDTQKKLLKKMTFYLELTAAFGFLGLAGYLLSRSLFFAGALIGFFLGSVIGFFFGIVAVLYLAAEEPEKFAQFFKSAGF